MSQSQPQTCPVCGVKIIKLIGGDRVIFSTGGVGTRAMLWARVCQYAKRPGCINSDPTMIGEIKPTDRYSSDS